MTDSAANPDQNESPRAFKRGGVLIFVVFPMVLILGFLLFQWWRKTSADPNLRLIAQVTDDISVELVAVAQYTGQSTPYTKWWKPNGLPLEGIVEDNLAVATPLDPSHYRIILLSFWNRNLPKEQKARKRFPAILSTDTSTKDNGKTVRVITGVSPVFLSGSEVQLDLASLGQQTVGVLNHQQQFFESVVHGLPARIEIGKAAELVSQFELKPGHSWAVRISRRASEPLWQSWNLKAIDSNGNSIDMVTHVAFDVDLHKWESFWQLKGDDWATVTVERTVYDMDVRFDGVAAREGSITSPSVGYVGESTSK